MLRPFVGRKIAVDFDEVLFPMLSQLNKHYAKKYKKRIPATSPKVYNYSKFYNINEYDSKVLVESFYHSHYAYSTKPINSAIESMKYLEKQNDLYIVTGRQNYTQCKSVTYYLLEKYFDGVFKDVYFTNSYSLKGEETPKTDICKTLGIDILIDDSISNCIEADLHNIESILYGIYDWNMENDNLQRIESWKKFSSQLVRDERIT